MLPCGCGAQGHLVQLARTSVTRWSLMMAEKKISHAAAAPVKVTNPQYGISKAAASLAVTDATASPRSAGRQHSGFSVLRRRRCDAVREIPQDGFCERGDRNKEWSEKDTMPILFRDGPLRGQRPARHHGGQIDSPKSLTEAGIQNAVSVPTGAMGFTWLENVWEWINGFWRDHRLRRLRKGRSDHVGRCAFPPPVVACEGRGRRSPR